MGKQKKEKYRNNKIQYDKKTVKALKICGLIFTIISIPSIILSNIPAKDLPAVLDTPIVILCILGLFGIIPIIFCWYKYIDGKLYLSELQKAGYEVPYDRLDYNDSLSKLPRTGDVIFENEGHNKGCIILAITSLLFAGGIFITDIIYSLKWHAIQSVGAFAVFIGILGLLWVLAAFIYYKRSDNIVYKNRYEDDNRKTRPPFSFGILTILIAGTVSIILISTPLSMTRYLSKSAVDSDREFANEIIRNVEYFYASNIDTEETKWDESFQDLDDGVWFFENDWDDDLFTSTIAKSYGANNISELKSRLNNPGSKLYICTDGHSMEADFCYTWEYGKTVTETLRPFTE